jgi:2-polyprenyl-6-hydroxyphenyl methylase/3-demethylubiquinone-9 3-methyltransferase
LIDELIAGAGREYLVEIGCGTGIHLFALASQFRHVHGTDFSFGMIQQAQAIRERHPGAEKITLCVDPAETLATVPDDRADVVLCVGALEHMVDQASVFRQVHRILKLGGVFVCLTPHGDYLWYTHLSGWLGLSSKHLSSDCFLDQNRLSALAAVSHLKLERIACWTFIPRGDMAIVLAWLLGVMDLVGRLLGLPKWRGGLCFRAVKPRRLLSDEGGVDAQKSLA